MVTQQESTSAAGAKKPAATKRITASQVADYLAKHPQFFAKQAQAELLEKLTIAHHCGENISLLEHQVLTLRKSYALQQERVQQLVGLHATNQRVLSGFLTINAQVLDTLGITELLAEFSDWWCKVFEQVDSVQMLIPQQKNQLVQMVEGNANVQVLDKDTMPDIVDSALRSQMYQVGQPLPDDLQTLVPDTQKSFLLLPYASPVFNAVVLITSHNPQRFASGMNADMAMFSTKLLCRRLIDLAALSASGAPDSTQQKTTAKKQTTTTTKQHKGTPK